MQNEPETLEFSEHYLEMTFRTDLRMRPAKYTAYGKQGRDCGDALEVFLDIADDNIIKLQYYSNGCYAVNACGNALAEVVRGKTIDEARTISAHDLAKFLETLPPHELHCAEMATAALQLALADYDAAGHKG